jgi:ATPases involved in chromosome partitioning
MRIAAIVSETPHLVESAVTARLAKQARQASPLPIALIRLEGGEAATDADPLAAPDVVCHSVAELETALQQARDVGTAWVFIDCRLAATSVDDPLTSAAHILIVPVEARRRNIEAVGTIIQRAGRTGQKLVFAMREATPARKVSAACALALSRFGAVVPAGLLGSPTSNAELLQAVYRLADAETASDIIQDWAAALSRADGSSSNCQVVRTDADDWHVRSEAPLHAGEAVTLTLSMLGRFEATVETLIDDGAVVRLHSDAARKQRLAERLAARIRARISPVTTEPATAKAEAERLAGDPPLDVATPEAPTPDAPTPDAPTSDVSVPTAPVADAANPPKRRVHSLLQQVSNATAAGGRVSTLNGLLGSQGWRGQRPPGRIIVVGNEKGGSGKSTLTIHLVVALLKEGFDVATVDLDRRQGSLTRYLENRRAFADRSGTALLRPSCHTVIDGHDDELRFSNLLMDLSRNRDYVVLDTPGHDQPLSRLAHMFADKVITPINDSFLDLDVIARLDPDTADYVGPSHYGQVMLQAREERGCNAGSPDWIVVRNRLSTVLARNKVDMAAAVERLSKEMGFRVGPGLTERVIYRELFPFGLTLLDLRDQGVGVSMTVSHVAARQELRALMQLLLPGLAAQVPLSKTGAAGGEPAARSGTPDRELASAQIGPVFADAPRAVEHVDAG